MDTVKTIGERIQSARGYKRMKQSDVANALDVSVQTVSNWEHGRRCPDAESIRKLVLLFGVTADWLLGLVDSPNMHVERSKKSWIDSR